MDDSKKPSCSSIGMRGLLSVNMVQNHVLIPLYEKIDSTICEFRFFLYLHPKQ